MISVSEYALLADAAYRDIRSLRNRPVLPTDAWSRVDRTQFGLSDSPDPSTGFSAEIFQNGNEIVISFEGTNPDALSPDGIRDWIANIKNAAGLVTEQFKQAALLYAGVKAAYPYSKITLTGHSLGGALAGLTSAFFNVPATVVDPGPSRSVANLATAHAIRQLLQDAGLGDTQLDALLSNSSNFQAAVDARLNLVQGYFLKGEIVEALRNQASTEAAWPLTSIDAGTSELGGIGLHSMQILEAVINSDAFRNASTKLSQLLRLMSDNQLYAHDRSDKDHKDFLQHLLEFQFGAPGITANDMLNAFGRDAQQIAEVGPLEFARLRNAVIATTIEYYNFATDGDLDFLKTETGGLSFDVSSIELPSDTRSKAAPLLKAALESLIPSLVGGVNNVAAPGSGARARLQDYKQWFIQGGTTGMQAIATASSPAAMIGQRRQERVRLGYLANMRRC